jgi:hypothetical protein
MTKAPPTPPRPYLGTLPRAFRSPMSAPEATRRLRQGLEASDVDGAVEDGRAWLRARARNPPAPPALWLTIAEATPGARITLRFDPSPYEEADLWVYAVAGFLGLGMIGLWTSGALPPVLRQRLTIAFPALLALLAAVVVVHWFIRQKLRRDRRRVLDVAMSALDLAAE